MAWDLGRKEVSKAVVLDWRVISSYCRQLPEWLHHFLGDTQLFDLLLHFSHSVIYAHFQNNPQRCNYIQTLAIIGMQKVKKSKIWIFGVVIFYVGEK